MKLRFASSDDWHASHSRAIRSHDSQPTGRVEAGEVKADGERIDRRRRRPPFALGQHLRLVMLGDRLLAALADVGRRLRLALLPAQPLEREMLLLAAVRARHEVAPLVGGLVLPLDPRQPLDRRRRGEEHLAPPGEGARPRFGQRHRIALVVGRRRIGVDLVEEQVAHRHRAQADGRVGAGQHQDAAGELLRQHRVAGVARPRRRHLLAQRRGSPRSADRCAAARTASPARPTAAPPASAPARGG